MVQGGKGAVRRLKRAQILLAADHGSTDEEIARNVAVGTSTVYRTKQRFVEEGLEAALSEAAAAGRAAEARRRGRGAALSRWRARSRPTGRARWTLQLLADEMVRLTVHDAISDETIRRRLGEMQLKPWQKKMWCIPKVDAEFVARMEDVLALYAEPPDARRPVVCFDETPRQLIGEERVPVRAEPGKRAASTTSTCATAPRTSSCSSTSNRPWRHAKVTDQRTCLDFAECMRDLVDEHYPDAERIRVVLDNLSTHSAGGAVRTLRARRGAPHPRAASSSTSRRSTRAGSTWSRSRSA